MVPSLAAPHALVTVSSSLRRPKRILLVDDDPLILKLVAATLIDAGYGVTSFSSGVAALERFREDRRFDLLVTDFQMPVMNGVILANLMTSVCRKLPVLIVSGSAAEDLPLWELWRKNWCFLAKPISAFLLLKTVDHMCGLLPIQMAETDLIAHRPIVSRVGPRP